ncbi:hypothetical protein GUI12_01850 [Anaplasmataceae bacterium AB001_6]|nr:hypothetical protein GUI12_01850 [Anaplasmataceae bacterium AB001_6]
MVEKKSKQHGSSKSFLSQTTKKLKSAFSNTEEKKSEKKGDLSKPKDSVQNFFDSGGKKTIKRSFSDEIKKRFSEHQQDADKKIDNKDNRTQSFLDKKAFFEAKSKVSINEPSSHNRQSNLDKKEVNKNIKTAQNVEKSNKKVSFNDNLETKTTREIDEMSRASKKLSQNNEKKPEKKLKSILKKPSHDLSNASAIEQSTRSNTRSTGR